jgi:hypothetical protein
MKKLSTLLLLISAFALSTTVLTAQTIVWPNDSISRRHSQFADANSIRFVRKDTALNLSLNNYKGWITLGLSSLNPAKADSAVFMWTSDGTAKIGAFSKTAARITSTDVTNGFGAAVFSSDFLDNRGVGTAAAFGTGPSPSPHSGELWSPIFDATGFNNLSLIFQQTNRHYQSGETINCFQSTAVSWSEDGGVTWKPLQCIEENEGYGFLESMPRNSPTVVKLVGSRGTNKFRVKFHFNGDYYYWLLDDVKVGVLANNVTLSKSWVAVPAAIMQRNNVDSTRFMVDVVNNGTVAAKNVKVTVDVLNSATLASVFTTTRNLGTIAPDAAVEDELLPQAYLAPASVGTYDIRYKVNYDSTDMFQRDDSIYFRAGLAVRDSFMTKQHGYLVTGGYGYDVGFQPTNAQNWKLGQYFYFPRGANSTATSISAAVETETATARTYTAGLYEWNDTNRNDSIEPTERRVIAFGEGTVPANSTTIDFVDIRLESAVDNKPVWLKNNQAYVAMLEFTPPTGVTDWYGMFDDRARYSYGPMKFATKKAGQARYAGVLDVNGGNPNAIWSTIGFGNAYLPRVELTAWPIRIDTKDDLPDTYKINVYPNPVGEVLNVNVDFPKSESAVLFRIFDLKGQLIQEKEFTNVQKETVNMNVNQLANGNYLLQVQTIGNQAKTLKFIKAN